RTSPPLSHETDRVYGFFMEVKAGGVRITKIKMIRNGDKYFPPAAAQVAHQKPHPSVEKLPPPQHGNQYIHSPINELKN
uniref:Uncharacterized protein n=1 Tax=Laticauda laticaudata TaxID=8630 RepID=A0A8C5WN92_LATLA